MKVRFSCKFIIIVMRSFFYFLIRHHQYCSTAGTLSLFLAPLANAGSVCF